MVNKGKLIENINQRSVGRHVLQLMMLLLFSIDVFYVPLCFDYRLHPIRSKIIDFLDKYWRSLWCICLDYVRATGISLWLSFVSMWYLCEIKVYLLCVKRAEQQQRLCSTWCEVPLSWFFLFFSNDHEPDDQGGGLKQIINHMSCHLVVNEVE